MKARRIDYSRVPELAAAGFPYDAICWRVRSLLDKQALVVRGELRCANTGKYRELLGLPEKQQ